VFSPNSKRENRNVGEYWGKNKRGKFCVFIGRIEGLRTKRGEKATEGATEKENGRFGDPLVEVKRGCLQLGFWEGAQGSRG